MVKKTSSGYKVVSQKGKNLGEYKTKKAAQNRLKDIEMFKHMKPKG